MSKVSMGEITSNERIQILKSVERYSTFMVKRLNIVTMSVLLKLTFKFNNCKKIPNFYSVVFAKLIVKLFWKGKRFRLIAQIQKDKIRYWIYSTLENIVSTITKIFPSEIFIT